MHSREFLKSPSNIECIIVLNFFPTFPICGLSGSCNIFQSNINLLNFVRNI